MISSTSGFSYFFISAFFFIVLTTTEGLVPSSKQFQYVNREKGSLLILENTARCRPIEISSRPFLMYFYNNTPDAYILPLGLGGDENNWMNRIVWAVNWKNPVRDDAKLNFGRDGNLVLADVDGRIAWQTNTANKGVVDLRLLPNGNLVLLNKQGGYVWQSFNYPKDALLVGQSLYPNKKLVSRSSQVDDSEGPYSMVLGGKRLAFYFKSKYSPKPLLYFVLILDHLIEFPTDEHPVYNVTFSASPYIDQGPFSANVLRLEYVKAIGQDSVDFTQVKYNATLSFLRLGFDGNLRIYTYYDLNGNYNPWEVSYTLFEFELRHKTPCQLPDMCGEFGLCEENHPCVACPTPKGLSGWSKNSCKPPKLPPCSKNTNVSQVSYYKLVGVDHFLNMFQEGEGPMKVGQCKKKCSKDCKCVAAFYRTDTSKCLITNQLNTLTKITSKYETPSAHLAFIKYSMPS